MWLCIVGSLLGWLPEFAPWVVTIIESDIVLGASVVLTAATPFVGDGDSSAVVCLVLSSKL